MRSNQLSYLAIALKASAKVIEIFIRAKVFNAKKKKKSEVTAVASILSIRP